MLSNLARQKGSLDEAINGQAGGQQGGAAERNKLFQGQGAVPSYANRGTEGEKTADLDDRGVLQLQRNMMRSAFPCIRQCAPMLCIVCGCSARYGVWLLYCSPRERPELASKTS